MRKALDLLESEGVLTRKQGRGTYVNGQGGQERAIRFRNIVAANRDPIAARVRLGPITAGPATELECARLSLPPQQEVYRIQRVHHYGDGPLMLDVASLPVDLFPGLLERQQTAESVTLLAQGYGILLGRAKERVSVGVAHATHAQALQIAAGSSVLILDRVVVALTGRPVEWRLAYCNGNNQCYVAKSD